MKMKKKSKDSNRHIFQGIVFSRLRSYASQATRASKNYISYCVPWLLVSLCLILSS